MKGGQEGGVPRCRYRRRRLASVGWRLSVRAIATKGWRREGSTVLLVGGAEECLVARGARTKKTRGRSPWDGHVIGVDDARPQVLPGGPRRGWLLVAGRPSYTRCLWLLLAAAPATLRLLGALGARASAGSSRRVLAAWTGGGRPEEQGRHGWYRRRERCAGPAASALSSDAPQV